MKFDLIVVTASNERQAEGYRALLSTHDVAETMVVPDPGGRRAGSLGSTLNVFRLLAGRYGRDPFARRRILICHSGGDSRRTPAYSAMGKAFAPMPCESADGNPVAMFDMIASDAERLPYDGGGQVVIVSGDCVVTMDDIGGGAGAGVTGIAWRDTMAEASRHGVYVADSSGRVTDFLQKPNPAEARKAGAVKGGRLLVDSGILMLDPKTCSSLLAFATENSAAIARAGSLDLYEEFTMTLAGREPKTPLVAKLAEAVRGTDFTVRIARGCEFFHAGSSRELLERLLKPGKTGRRWNFAKGAPLLCNVAGRGRGQLRRGVRAFVEGCSLSETPVLKGDNILTGVPAECTLRIELPRGTGLVVMPIGARKWSAVAYSLDDNFKSDGRWDAKLWRVGTADEAIGHALSTLACAKGSRPRSSERLFSMAELVGMADRSRMVSLRDRIRCEELRHRVAVRIESAVPPPKKPERAKIGEDQVVWATAPARIDFAGGWSDTPPICLDMGGTVLNAAVTLNGQHPIQAIAKLIPERKIRVSSVDLGQSQVFTDAAEIQDHSDPHDWCALAKAALILTGVAPAAPGADLSRWLGRIGGGLDLSIFSALPKGSGLGTSSILGAVAIACLDRVFGRPFDVNRIFAMTSALEQRLSTGGGWQDQAGGALPGMKLLESSPGIDQAPRVRNIAMTESVLEFFRDRCLLYFTGRKRMARNVLHRIVDRFLSRDSGMREIVERLKAGARRTADALSRGDVEGFARGLGEYWKCKKELDPGSTTPEMERLVGRIGRDATAVSLTGAGGGGFLFAAAKSKSAAERIRKNLESRHFSKASRFFSFEIDTRGMEVEVL